MLSLAFVSRLSGNTPDGRAIAKKSQCDSSGTELI